MSESLNNLLISTESPRQLSQLMLALNKEDWIELFLNDNVPNSITAHITKYFTISKNINFHTLTSGALFDLTTYSTVSVSCAIKGLCKNKSIPIHIKTNLSILLDLPLAKTTVVKKTNKPSPVKVAITKPSSPVKKKATPKMDIDIKANIKTKFGIVSEMQVGTELNGLFSGLFVLNKQTFFIHEGRVSSSSELKDSFIESILNFLNNNGVIIDEEIDASLWILTTSWKKQHSFSQSLNISHFMEDMSISEKQNIIKKTIDNNIKTIFTASRMASFINELDPEFAKQELAKLNISLEVLLNI